MVKYSLVMIMFFLTKDSMPEGYGLNLLWDTNFMFLMRPDKGNPLELFEKLLGSHLWGFPILLPIVILIMHLPVLIAKKVKK